MALKLSSDKSYSETPEFIESLVGKHVKINRGGPESFEGKLLAVKKDYLVISTKNGVAYISESHVKSFTRMSGNKSGHWTPDYVDAPNFKDVVRALKHKFVQINWGGPEKVEGFLAEVDHNSVLLIKDKEAIQIQLFHIKTIGLDHNNRSGSKSRGSKSGGKSGGNKSGGKSGDHKSGGKSGGHKSSGRSGDHRSKSGRSKDNCSYGDHKKSGRSKKDHSKKDRTGSSYNKGRSRKNNTRGKNQRKKSY